MEIRLIKKRHIAMTRNEIAKSFGISPKTVDLRVKEIEEEVKAKRYGPHSIMRDVGLVLINPLVFADYMTYRARLRNKNLRKNVPPYNAYETSKEFELQLEVEEA